MERSPISPGTPVSTRHSARNSCRPSGFSFFAESESGVLDKQEYGTSFVTPEVASPRAHAGFAQWRRAPLVRGSITRAEVRGDGTVWVGGWTRLPSYLDPVDRVELIVDDERVIETHLAPHTTSLPLEAGGERFQQTGWYVEGPAGDLAPGPHTLCAVGRAAGVANCIDARILRL